MYTTVYDLDTQTLWKAYVVSEGRSLLPFVLVVSGFAIYAIWRRRWIYLLPLVPLAFFLSFWTPFMVNEFRYGRTLLDQYTAGKCRIAEGTTHVQAQQRLEGHSIDKITIGAVPLQISHFEVGPHYRDSIVYGGVLKDGVAARVWYCPSTTNGGSDASAPIVRVDIKNTASR
jgi:hypothetical protein